MTAPLVPPTPFGEAWPRVQLSAAPLVRVVAQVRFSQVLRVSDEAFITPFQEAIRDQYPELSRELQQQVVITDKGAQPGFAATIWRFRDPASGFQVSLAPDFVALDTSSYTDRHDFFGRFTAALDATAEHIHPGLATRLGVRYVDRLEGESTSRLPKLIRAELLTFENVDLGSGVLQRGISEAEFAVGENQLKARWGLMPPETTHDPSIEPSKAKSWILDLDASTQELGSFDAPSLSSRARDLGDVVYRFFRWVVSETFLEEHGGDL